MLCAPTTNIQSTNSTHDNHSSYKKGKSSFCQQYGKDGNIQANRKL